MDMDSDSVFSGRLEVVSTGRRRRWSAAEKVRIVEKSLASHRQASATARRHGISTARLFRWRKDFREGWLGNGGETAFVPAVVVANRAHAAAGAAGSGGRTEIVARGGHQVIVGPDVAAAALARVLAGLEGP